MLNLLDNQTVVAINIPTIAWAIRTVQAHPFGGWIKCAKCIPTAQCLRRLLDLIVWLQNSEVT